MFPYAAQAGTEIVHPVHADYDDAYVYHCLANVAIKAGRTNFEISPEMPIFA